MHKCVAKDRDISVALSDLGITSGLYSAAVLSTSQNNSSGTFSAENQEYAYIINGSVLNAMVNMYKLLILSDILLTIILRSFLIFLLALKLSLALYSIKFP